MNLPNPSDQPTNSLIFLSDQPGDVIVIEREAIVDEHEEGPVTIGTHIVYTDCKSGEERVIDNYL